MIQATLGGKDYTPLYAYLQTSGKGHTIIFLVIQTISSYTRWKRLYYNTPNDTGYIMIQVQGSKNISTCMTLEERIKKNDRNGCKWQSGISKSLEEYVQPPVFFVNVQSSFHENVVFSVCAQMCNAAYIIFIICSSISGLDT